MRVSELFADHMQTYLLHLKGRAVITCIYKNPDMYKNTHPMGYGKQELDSKFEFAVSKVLPAKQL